jgi:uncharacterized protein YbjT (DUF2867 family)
MIAKDAKTIAVIGATGVQGGGVVQALQERGHFKVRVLTRSPDKARGLAEEVVAADLTRPETLSSAFDSAYGVFANTNSFAGPDVDEVAQGTAAVEAARAAGVDHFIWSTLPNVADISSGAFNVPHFTNKATVDKIVEDADFRWFTFVEPPFYYQNLTGPMYVPQPGPDGTPTWSQPMRSDVRGIHIGDITELGNVVAGAFEHPDVAGQGQHLSLAGDLMSWDDIVATLNSQGHHLAYTEVSDDPWGIRGMFAYFEAHTYFGPDADTKWAGHRPGRRHLARFPALRGDGRPHVLECSSRPGCSDPRCRRTATPEPDR